MLLKNKRVAISLSTLMPLCAVNCADNPLCVTVCEHGTTTIENDTTTTGDDSTDDSTPTVDDGLNRAWWKATCYTGTNYFWNYYNGAPHLEPANGITPCVYVDPNDPNLEDAIKEGCTDACIHKLNFDNLGTPSCDVEGWSSADLWHPLQPCTDTSLDLNLIEGVLGAPAAADASDLSCNLPSSCISELDHDAAYGMLMPPGANTRNTAAVLMETDTNSTSTVGLLGQSTDVYGHAAYSALSCPDDACPFYLAQWDVEATSALNVSFTLDHVYNKSVANIHVALQRPALGLWLPSSGDIIFPPNALTVLVEGDVVEISGGNLGDGPYLGNYRIDGYVFGTLDGGVLTLAFEHSDAFLGSYGISGSFVEE